MAKVEKVKDFIKANKKEIFVLVLILFLGSFLRFYRISEYMTFLGDEGRDAIIVRRFITELDLMLIGPGTSIGNMYLGPLYYYMMAPALWLFGLSPVGPAVQIAVLGVITIGFVWWVGREWFSSVAGLIVAFLYAISPTVIIYSRSSWNPNIMPFFALLSIYAIWRVYFQKEFKWLLALGVSLAFVLQSHYLGLLLFPAVGIFWLHTLYSTRYTKNARQGFIKHSLLAGGVFTLLMSPLVIFDYRHGWQNFAAIKKFFLERQTTVSARPWNALPKAWPILQEISTRLVAGRNELVGQWSALGMVITTFMVAGVTRFKISKKESKAFFLLLVWMGFALLGLGLYKQEIYDHYYGFFFAAPFLLIGGILDQLLEKAKFRGWWIVGTVVAILAFYSFQESPLKYPPNRQLQRTREIAEFINEKSEREKFNLGVIAERNYEDAYQYFLEMWDTRVTDIDPLNSEETITNQLFVVCELGDKEKCDPTHNAKAEVANFGWSKVEEYWDISGVRIYKLVHTQ